MRDRLKSLLWPSLFTLAMAAFLVSLGVWQLHRLAWKEAILSQIATRSTVAAAPLPVPDLWAALVPADYDYSHVALDGVFENDREALVFHSGLGGKLAGAGPGYLVLTPLRLDSGAHVIVNRGFVPLNLADPAQRAAGQLMGLVHITGLMRPPESRNLFTPADDPAKGRYFTRDPALISAHFGLTQPAPFTIDADDAPVPGGWPRGGTTERTIPNNHLSYALTWFGLAIGLLGVFAAFAWRRLYPAAPTRGLELGSRSA